MSKKQVCPLCLQDLPEGVTAQSLHDQVEHATEAAIKQALTAQKKQLEAELRKDIAAEMDKKYAPQIEAARKAGAQESATELTTLRAQVRTIQQNAAADAKRAKAEGRLEAQQEQSAEVLKWKNQSNKLSADVARLTAQLEQSNAERLGEKGERSLYEILNDARNLWPGDTVRRTTRGEKGGDTIYTVMDGHREAGRIIFESKYSGVFDYTFLAQVSKYRTQYDTPYVVIVPQVKQPSVKARAACEKDGIPVVKLSEVVSLVSAMRIGILTIFQLRRAGEDVSGKAKSLLDYIVSNDFRRRFDDIEAHVTSLSQLQQKEKTSHETHWTRERELYENILAKRRTMEARLDGILKSSPERKSPGRAGNGKDNWEATVN